jgi:hypothetical protein
MRQHPSKSRVTFGTRAGKASAMVLVSLVSLTLGTALGTVLAADGRRGTVTDGVRALGRSGRLADR